MNIVSKKCHKMCWVGEYMWVGRDTAKKKFFVGSALFLKGLLHCFSTCIEITGNN